MARHYLLVCDACGRKQSERVEVHHLRGTTDDNRKMVVDLCLKCMKKMHDEYNMREEEERPRKGFEVIPYDDIPRG